MKWKKILKMPVPFDTDTQRDEDYKQDIIQYEKTVIEPELTQWVQSGKALKGVQVTFRYDDSDTKNKFFDASGDYFFGATAVKELGGNFPYILQVLDEIYAQEGYTTKMSGRELAITKG